MQNSSICFFIQYHLKQSCFYTLTIIIYFIHFIFTFPHFLLWPSFFISFFIIYIEEELREGSISFFIQYHLKQSHFYL